MYVFGKANRKEVGLKITILVGTKYVSVAGQTVAHCMEALVKDKKTKRLNDEELEAIEQAFGLGENPRK